MGVNTLDIALRIQADLASGRAQVDGIAKSVADIGKAAEGSNASLNRINAQLDGMTTLSQQAVQLLQSMNDQLSRMTTASRDQASANSAVAASAREATEALKAQGETEQQQTARIKDMVRASLEQQAANKAIAESEVSLAERAGRRVELSTAERLALNENAKAMRAKVAAQIEAIATAEKAAAATTVAVKGERAASQAMHSFSLNTSMARMELGRLVKDLATGQYGRLTQSGLTLANYTGVMSAIMSPIGLVIGATTAALVAFGAAALTGERDVQQLNQAIIESGNYAGVTTGQLRTMAAQMSAPFDQAQEALRLLTASGKVTGDRLQEAAQGAIDLSTVTGQSISKSVADFVKLQGDPVHAVKALDDSMHFLTLQEYENIKALQAQGDADDAAAIAQTALSRAVHDRALEVKASAGIMERAWKEVHDTVEATWDAMKRVGAPTTNTEDLANANAGLQRFKDRLPQTRNLSDQQLLAAAQNPSDPNHPFFAGDLGTIQQLIAQKESAKAGALWEKWVAETDADNTRIMTQAKAASDTMDKYLKAAKANKDKAAEIAAVKDATAKLIAAQPQFTAQYQADEKTALAEIEKKYKPPKVSMAVEHKAESAQEQLLKLLNDEQGAVDPVAKAWAIYNDKVTKANQLAAEAVKAKGANVAAIHAERDAVIEAAAKARDASIAKIADKDRKAFERLRDSLKSADGIKLDKIRDELELLQKDLQKGVITADEYRSAVQGVLNNGLKQLPSYGGVGSSVGGPFGELDKIDAARTKLDDAYKADLDALKKFHDQKLLSDEQFIAAEEKLNKDHRDKQKALDDASIKVKLQGLTQSFASAAQIIRQGFGAQSEEYRIAFALSKAAAIAQASVNMWLDISKASSKGWPANIPLIAQATAEGISIIGSLRSISAGFSEGGYTGPGAKNKPAGIVHAGEWVQPAYRMQEAGAMAFMADFQQMGMAAISAWSLGGYADGGFVSPLHDAPRLPVASIVPASLPRMAANDSRGATQLGVRIVNHVDPQVTYDAMNSPDGETVIVNTIARNATKVRQMIGGG